MQLTFKLATGEKLEYKVKDTKCIIGRSPKCQVVIPHEGLSRQHCLIEAENNEVFITDLDSTNGVFIDGKRISPSTRTEFKTYLPLSFGPVESLVIDIDDMMDTTSPNLTIHPPGGYASAANKTVMMSPPKKEAAKPAAKKKQIPLIASVIMGIVAIGAFVYVYLSSNPNILP